MGAWARNNITRTGLITLLVSIFTTMILINKYGLPDTVIGYSSTINSTLIILAALTIFTMFISFNYKIKLINLYNS